MWGIDVLNKNYSSCVVRAYWALKKKKQIKHHKKELQELRIYGLL